MDVISKEMTEDAINMINNSTRASKYRANNTDPRT